MTIYAFNHVEVNGVTYLTPDVTATISADTTVVSYYVAVGGGGSTGGSGGIVYGYPEFIKLYGSRPPK